MRTDFTDKNYLVVDDNLRFLNLLTVILNEIGVKHINTSQSAQEAYQLFKKKNIDLCILDIDLNNNQEDGIQLAEQIRSLDLAIPIIYMTSHFTETYYQRCRHTNPSSFMNKELSCLKLQQAIELALFKQSVTKKPDVDLDNSRPPYFSDETLYFKIGDSYKALKLEDIDFFFGKDKMVFARVGNRNYPTNIKLKSLEKELHPHFIRIHRSYLINKYKITSINARVDRVEIGGEQLLIGHTYKKDFFSKIRLMK